MQFKKTFSSNLQNLAVKTTMVVPPPGRDNHKKTHERSPYASALSKRYECDKQNIKTNSSRRQDKQSLSASRSCSAQRQRDSPVLTFHKVRKHLIEVQIQKMQNQYQSNPSNKPPPVSQFKDPLLAHSNSTNLISNLSSSSLHTTKRKSHVRFGSMVFGSAHQQEPTNQSQKREDQIRASKSQQKRRSWQGDIECMNGDGRTAMFKVLKCDSEDEEMLHYCHACTMPLVKQGFIVQELTPLDKQSIRSSKYMEESRRTTSSHHRSQQSKLGQQVKCKIIIKLNKMRASKEQFMKHTQNAMNDIDYFYSSLIKLIEQHKEHDQQELTRMVNTLKAQPQTYMNKLSSCLGTVDYLIKNRHNFNEESLADVYQMVQSQVLYPNLPVIQPKQGFQHKIQQFSSYFDRNIRLSLQDDSPYSHQQKIQQQMRFSFEEALEESRRKKLSKINHQLYPIQPLYEQNESQMQDSIPSASRHSAFRNLFPQEEDVQQDRHSPVFKQF